MASCVVVIEDELELQQMLVDLLEMNGVEAIGITAPDSIQSIDASLHPDLFLVDLMLPGMSGIEFTQQLRSAGYADTPMIAMSASRPMLEVAADSHLFQDTLRKPFDISTLMEVITRNQ